MPQPVNIYVQLSRTSPGGTVDTIHVDAQERSPKMCSDSGGGVGIFSYSTLDNTYRCTLTNGRNVAVQVGYDERGNVIYQAAV